jgi:hypothetical protein
MHCSAYYIEVVEVAILVFMRRIEFWHFGSKSRTVHPIKPHLNARATKPDLGENIPRSDWTRNLGFFDPALLYLSAPSQMRIQHLSLE